MDVQMNEKQAAEVQDEALDIVSGGVNRKSTSKAVICAMPGCDKPTTNPSGYCSDCQNMLIREGRPPLL